MLRKKNRTTINLNSFQSLKILWLKCIIHFILKSSHFPPCEKMETLFSRKLYKLSYENVEKLFFVTESTIDLKIEVRFAVLIYTPAHDLLYSSREQSGKELRPYWLFVIEETRPFRANFVVMERSVQESYRKYLNKTPGPQELMICPNLRIQKSPKPIGKKMEEPFPQFPSA